MCYGGSASQARPTRKGPVLNLIQMLDRDDAEAARFDAHYAGKASVAT